MRIRLVEKRNFCKFWYRKLKQAFLFGCFEDIRSLSSQSDSRVVFDTVQNQARENARHSIWTVDINKSNSRLAKLLVGAITWRILRKKKVEKIPTKKSASKRHVKFYTFFFFSTGNPEDFLADSFLSSFKRNYSHFPIK